MAPHSGDITVASTAPQNVGRDSGSLCDLGRFCLGSLGFLTLLAAKRRCPTTGVNVVGGVKNSF